METSGIGSLLPPASGSVSESSAFTIFASSTQPSWSHQELISRQPKFALVTLTLDLPLLSTHSSLMRQNGRRCQRLMPCRCLFRALAAS